MAKYGVPLYYTASIWQEVEADNALEARDKALAIVSAGPFDHGPLHDAIHESLEYEDAGEPELIVEEPIQTSMDR